MITTFQNLTKAAHNVANPCAIDVLKTKRKDLIYGILHTVDLLDHIVREGILTTKKKCIILTMRTRHEQNSRILDVIEANGERACRKFIHPCLMRVEPELYYQICEYVKTMNEHIRDSQRQLIGYLLEQDQVIMHEIMKRHVNQRANVILALKEGRFETENMVPQLDLAITNPNKPASAEVKIEEITNNTTDTFDAKTQSNAEQLIQPESEDLRTAGSAEVMEAQTPTQATAESSVKDAWTLHRAAQEDDWHQIECLVQNGAEIEARDCQNKTALFYAVAEGYENTVSALLKAGAKVDYEILNEAIKQKQNSVLKMLFDKARGAASEEDLNFAVFSSVRQNRDTALLALIDSGADINIFDKQGYSPLLLSAEMGHSQVFRVLLEKQANRDATLSDRSSVLHLAALGGSVPIMKELLEKGLNPNTPGPKAQTPLHLAAALHTPDVVHLLLTAGAQINSTAQDGVTPLHVASQHGNEEIVACLIQNKAKIEAEDKLGRTALHWASVAPKESNVMNALLSFKQINVNALDNEKRSALHLAAMEGNLENVTSLLSHKAKAVAKDKNGSTPMHYAAAGGHVSTVSALLQSLKKKSIDERNTWKKTALHVAAEKGHDTVVSLLLEAGAKINAKDQNKDTPLHWAVRGGHLGGVKELVDWGQGSAQGTKADLQATNSVKKTALQLAQSGGTQEHENIATLLKRKMLIVK
ncbi:CARD- and ANK-domain containing inflammasome adapter protein [Eucyclogobius newberryi]|uniref:CARD- and ANK-domain containing inflammasome adapter protein n=1 Tax=Eucyclogobius newberryi TaxID=166745 RepID=UPI003B5BD304